MNNLGFKGLSPVRIAHSLKCVPKDKRRSFLEWAWETDYFQPKLTIYREQERRSSRFECHKGHTYTGPWVDGKTYTEKELGFLDKETENQKWKLVFYYGGMRV